MATVTELVTKFSFAGNLSKLTDFNAGLGKGIALVSGFAIATKAVSAAILGFTANTLNAIEPMTRLADNTGVGVERLQELQYAATTSGSSVDAINGTLTEFSKKVGEASIKGVEQFKQLGVNVKDANGQLKSTDVLLLEVGDKLRGLDKAKQIEIGSKLGIDKTVIGLITQSGDQLDQLSKRARQFGLITEEQAKSVQRTTSALKTLQFGMNAIRQQIAIAFAPQLEALSNWFVELIANNRDLIVNGLTRLGKIITTISAGINRLAPFIGVIVGGFIAWKIAALGVSGALAAINAVIKKNIVVIAITAILLLIDDLIVAFKGGKSLIRDFFLEFFGWDITPTLKAIVDGITWLVGQVQKSVMAVVDFFASIFKGMFALATGDVDGFIGHFKDAFSGLVDGFYNMFKPFINWISEQIEKILPDWVKDALGIESAPSQQTTEAAAGINTGFDKLISDAMLASGGSGVVINQTVNNNTNVTATANNPEQVAKDIGTSVNNNLQNGLKTANDQAKRGGR